MVRVAVGTSGYAYKEWKGSFYPAQLSANRMLAWYGARLPTVEINNTFYRMPSEATLRTWSTQVPPAFRFAIKAPGRITHQLRLRDAADATGRLWAVVATLGERLGPVLFGLPPNMKKDRDRLAAFLELLPPGRQVAFEFRHESWFDEETWALLRARDVALCIADAEELTTPVVATASFGYLRLRRATYDADALGRWATVIADAPWRDAVVYLKHEDEGRAPALAAQLTALLPQPPAPGAP